jgi:hypothetical protein
VRHYLRNGYSFRFRGAVLPLAVQRQQDRAGAVDDGLDQFGLGRPEVQVRGQPARRTDARGTVRVHHGVELDLGDHRVKPGGKARGGGRGAGSGSGAGTETSRNQ